MQILLTHYKLLPLRGSREHSFGSKCEAKNIAIVLLWQVAVQFMSQTKNTYCTASKCFPKVFFRGHFWVILNRADVFSSAYLSYQMWCSIRGRSNVFIRDMFCLFKRNTRTDIMSYEQSVHKCSTRGSRRGLMFRRQTGDVHQSVNQSVS